MFFKNNKSNIILLLVCLLTLSFYADYAEASHFRYSTLSWQYLSPNTFRVTVKVAFRYKYFVEWLGSSPYQGFTFFNYDLILEYSKRNWLNQLVTSTTTYSNIVFTTEYADPIADWITASSVVDVTFPSEAVTSMGGRITYYGTNRIANLQNNAELPWNVTSTVPLTGLTTANSSPVSGMLPIVPAYNGQANSIPVLASHQENPNANLKFSLSKWTGMTQPGGMTIDANTGVITYTPTAVGLWCAQVVVTETNGLQSSISVDFIVNVTAKPVTQDLPPYFQVPPTPAQGSYEDFVVNTAKSFPLRGVSPQSGSKVTISNSNLPAGMNYTTQTASNPNTVTFSWAPTMSQVGVYIFSAGLVDNKGNEMVGGVHSFFLRVSAAACGNGHAEVNGSCTCNNNWTGTKCDQCKPGFYGALCLPLPPCQNGQSNGGTDGDGKCICDPGYQGPACNVSIVKYCSPSDPNAIIQQSQIDSLSAVKPDFVQVSLTPTGSQLQIPLQLTGKNIITAEIFILLDTSVTAANTARYKQFITQHNLFRATFAANRDAILYGLGTFSDSANQPNSFQLNANPMTDITTTLNSVALLTGSPSANIPYSVLIDAIPKIGFSNSGTMKIIYLVTDNNIAPTDNTLVSKLVKALDTRNILLGVFALDSVSSYAPLFSAAGAGYSYAWPSTTSDSWFSLFITNIYTPMINNIVVKVVSDEYSIVATPPPTTSTTTWYTGLLLPTPAPTALTPVVKLNVVGFDKQTIAVAINHAPTTSSVAITTDEDQSTTFSIVGSDIDLNLLNVALTQLPSKGSIKINGVVMVLGQSYALPASTSNAFTFVPTLDQNGADVAKFTVSDGCLSAAATISIQINPVNDPPTCQPLVVSTDQYGAKTFVLNVADVDSPALTVEFQASASTLQSLGSFKDATTANVVDGTKYPSTTQFTFTPYSSANGSAAFTYVVRDQALSSQCTALIQVVRVNVAPTLSVQTPVNMIPDSTKVIPFTVRDTDNGETLTVTIVSAAPVGGEFFGPQGQSLASVAFPLTIGTFDVSSTHEQTSQISYKSPNSQPTGVSITLKVTDTSGVSETKVVQISITGTRVNYAPTATPAGPITLDQDTLSPSFVLNGTDPDQSRGYDNILDIVISSYPKNGQLQTPVTGTPLANPLKTALSVVYAPKPGYFGSDQLTFYVVDSLGNASLPVTVQIVVNHVNHAPAISASDIFVTGRQNQWPNTPITIAASDVDQGDVLTVSVTLVPVVGTILKSDGSAISTVPTVISNLSISYAPSATTFYSLVQPYTVKVCDNAVPSLCSSASANIHYTYVNSAPTGEAVSKSGLQDQSLPFNLKGSDFEDGSNVVFYLTTLPSYGQLFSAGNLVTSTSQQLLVTGLTYVPNAGVSNDDTPGKLGPVESLFYVVSDKNNTKSTNYPITLFIEPVKPPIYTGESNFTTLEDTKLSIALNAISQTGATSFEIDFTSYTNNGKIYFVSCTANDPSCLTEIDPSQDRTFAGPPFNLVYIPPADAFGDDMDRLTFVLKEKHTSIEYAININVVPVNDPPVFMPLTYTGFLDQVRAMSPVVTITVNSTSLLTWNATDIDSPYTGLVSSLQSNIKSGKFLTYEGEPTPSNTSRVLAKGDLIPRSADGLWRAFYIPTPGRFGKGHEIIAVNIIDSSELSSALYTMRVDVNPINRPPVVTVNQSYWEVNPKTSATILGVSVDDPDSNQNDISLTLTLTPADGLIELPLSKNSSSCHYNGTNVITCKAPKTSLNQFLTLIKLNFTQTENANYSLTVFVSDLGFVGGNVLTDQKNVDVKILSSPVSKPNNTTILSVAIAAAAAGAAAIAIGVWRLMKARMPPTDAFFGDAPFADANINSNPLYQDSNRNQMNPLYENAA
ncbi:substrate adhesion molecule [Cavenderia fasciculata]|uniref:Substrate adhesion molecule n=1 Tax=Cavenderia fasciculata TaxID=261658 RepID=F4Q500_CACFS|nr:substrate adhesion molecule [Cavenderia fasciculata]EGG17106.1 substrate adhesion molecule [Cavenderia fasciculata]|eukprot:XP_004355590.1 substrate adhesion molecule [Cavenderia fasciculata]